MAISVDSGRSERTQEREAYDRLRRCPSHQTHFPTLPVAGIFQLSGLINA